MLYIHNNCCRSSDVACYPFRLCYLCRFIRQYISSDRDFNLFSYLEVQNSTQLFGIALCKNQPKSVTLSPRINSNGLFSPTASVDMTFLWVFPAMLIKSIGEEQRVFRFRIWASLVVLFFLMNIFFCEKDYAVHVFPLTKSNWIITNFSLFIKLYSSCFVFNK